MSEDEVTITLDFDDEEYRQIVAVAAVLGLTPEEFVAKALRDYVATRQL